MKIKSSSSIQSKHANYIIGLLLFSQAAVFIPIAIFDESMLVRVLSAIWIVVCAFFVAAYAMRRSLGRGTEGKMGTRKEKWGRSPSKSERAEIIAQGVRVP